MRTGALRIGSVAYLLLIVSLGWMRHPLTIGGLKSFPTDWLFLVACAAWGAAVVGGATALRFHRGFWFLAAYFAAMALSLMASGDVPRSAFKLLTQAYLLFLPVLTFNLVRSRDQLKRVAMAWIGVAAAISLIGTLAVVAFAIFGPTPLFNWTYHNFGTLPPGPYRRLQLTFEFPSVLANYLGVALLLILASRAEHWLSARLALAMATVVCVTSFFALTPGLGGVAFMVAAWCWYRLRPAQPWLAVLMLAFAFAMPLLAVVISSVSPLHPPSSPFLIVIPGLPPLDPSVRLLAWVQASAKLLSSPVFGIGIGIDPVDVAYEIGGCGIHCISDAHNTYLSIAAQCGLIGLAAQLALIAYVASCLIAGVRRRSNLVVALSLAWIGSFAMQGLVGSFEDQRHLWVLLGLLFSAEAIDRESDRGGAAGKSSWPKAS